MYPTPYDNSPQLAECDGIVEQFEKLDGTFKL
jgi:hypothetical protein